MALKNDGTGAADEPASATLAQRAGRALGWNVANALVSRLGTLAIGIALARILGPEEFGTFAVALLALTAVLSFNELGVSLAIVRWPGPPREIAPTVATLSTVSSAALFVIALIAAPWFCSAMHTPQATDAVRLLSVNILLSGIVATPAGLLQREFRAGRRMFIDQVGTWVGAIISIITALAGLGAMSLAIGRLGGMSCSTVLFLVSAPMRFGYDRVIAGRLLSFGLPLAGSSIVVFAVTYIDQFLVGAILGPIALGFYVLAFNLASWPVNVCSQPVRQVSPATFARLQGDPPALRTAFVLSTKLLTAATLPICLVLAGAAVPLVHVVYGSPWAPAASALAWLGVLAGIRILSELAYDYFVVLGGTRVVFGVQVAWLVALIPALYVGATYGGIAGAAAAHVAAGVLVVLPIYLWELRRVGVSPRQIAAGVAAPVGYAAGVGIIAFGVHRVTSVDLIALAVAGLAALGALALQRRSLRAALDELRSVVSAGAQDEEPRAAPLVGGAPVSHTAVPTYSQPA